jgi:tRNA (cytidine/uridine-2'-O-)-methyltransferase
MQDKQMRRAGLDYHEYASVKRHASWQAFVDNEHPDASRCFALSTHGKQSVFDQAFQAGNWLVFGAETRGLSEALRQSLGLANCLRLPMVAGQRSLNLSNAVAVTVFEAWRQQGFALAGQSDPPSQG